MCINSKINQLVILCTLSITSILAATVTNASTLLWVGGRDVALIQAYDLSGNFQFQFNNVGGYTADGMTAVGENIWVGSSSTITMNVYNQAGILVNQIANAGGNGVASMATYGDKVFVGSAVTDTVNVYDFLGNLSHSFANPGGYTTTAMTVYGDTLSIATGGNSLTHFNEISAINYSLFNSVDSTYDRITALANPYDTLSLQGVLLGQGDNEDLYAYNGTNLYSQPFDLIGRNATYEVGSLAVVTMPEEPAPTVPVPAAFWLFGSGLIGLVGMARRKKS